MIDTKALMIAQYVCCFFAERDTPFDSVVFIAIGVAMTAYGIFAKTFIESGKIHVLTPSNKLERYIPRWYHRTLLTVLGLALVFFGFIALWKH
jgi:hypothetical protein